MKGKTPQAAPPPPQPKLGASHFGGMWRLGLSEIGQITAAFPESVQPTNELGLLGTALPQDVYESRHQREAELQHNVEIAM